MAKVVHSPVTALFPVPVVLATCGVDRPNIITLAWVGTVCSEPPTIGVAVRPTRYSHGLIQDAGEFVVNLPNTTMVSALNLCGTLSGRNRDKFDLCGFTPVPASRVQVPLIAECPVHLECILRQTVPLGSHDLFLAEIMAVQVDEAIVDARGQIDLACADLLCYMGPGAYHAVGERLVG